MKKYFRSVDEMTNLGVLVALVLPVVGVIMALVCALKKDWFRMNLFFIWTGIGLAVDLVFALVSRLFH